jgi:hypothetical protein
MALVMVMTMAQCKKDSPTTPDNQNNVVTITLEVKNNNGSRVDVNTITGTVDFETGDKVYVGSGGKYVGFLTHNGTNFVGNITNPTENQPLQFYFLGNVTPIETLSAGTTEECSVIISDQTEYLPVISCAASFENYVSGLTSYTGHLLNKCALVKFNVTTPSNSPICITGMKNKVTVDFSQNTVTPSIDGDGVIMLSAGSGENVEKWAILLPQEALEEGEEGSTYLEDETYTGIRPAVPAITENGYLADGITLIINTIGGAPVGGINGLFSVSGTKQVWFSQGNLQYQASTNTWRFAEHQWNFVGGNSSNGYNYGNVGGSSNNNISSTYSGWIDLFGWGTSGYNHGAVCYQPWSTNRYAQNYYAYGFFNFNLFDETGMADWGYNPIINGGSQENMWRTLTADEWEYVFNTRVTSSGVRYVKAMVNNVKGIILLPDEWDNSIYNLSETNNNEANFTSNTIVATEWTEILESNGAVFMPVSGSRDGTNVSSVNTCGYYWSASYGIGYEYYAYIVRFLDGYFNATDNSYRGAGLSVRLVRDAE